MKILFLDIDGVLNDHTFNKQVGSCRIDAAKAKLVNYIIEKTDCKLVISSAWRYLVLKGAMTLGGFETLLQTHWVNAYGRVFSVTTSDEFCTNCSWTHLERIESCEKCLSKITRGRQIKYWVDCHKPDSFCVLDDIDLGFSEFDYPFVDTDGSKGISLGDAEKVICLLNNASS